MFWYRPLAVLSLLALIIFCCNCRNNKTTVDTAFFTDTQKISLWENSYDTLYDKYRPAKETKFLQQAGIFADSILFFEKQLLKDTSEQKTFFYILFNRAIDLNDLHYYVKSRELLDKYLILYQQFDFSKLRNIAYAKKTLGNIYSRYGDYEKALHLLNQALEYYDTTKDKESTASCLLNKAIALKEFYRYDEAENELQKIFNLEPLGPKRKGIACTELADIYIRQKKLTESGLQIQKAKQFLTAAYKIAIAHKDKTDDITEAYADLYSVEGNLYMVTNEPRNSLTVYRQSLDSAKTASSQNLRKREIGKIYIAMGNALEQLHFPDSALHYYTRALYTVITVDTLDKFSLPQQKDIYAENTIAEALYARADCIIARRTENEKELENAVSCYKLAFATERKLLDAFTYDESRLQMVEETRKQAEKAIAVCYQLYQKTNNKLWANEAFLFAEHNKAFVLAESVRRNTAASLLLPQDTLHEKVQSLQSNLAVTEIELNKQKFFAVPDTALIRALTISRQKAEEEFLAAENSLRIKNPQYNDQITKEASLSAEEIINKTVSAGSTFVEYFTGDSSVYVFSGEKNKPLDLYKLPGAIKNIADSFLHFFSSQSLILNNPLQYAGIANKLFLSILGPYMHPGNRSLLIIPDGFICHIPFDALLTAATTSTEISSFPFLIKQQETHYAFSCKTLLAQAENKNYTADNSVAGFAPVFANKERGLSPLLHSNDELEVIKQFYPQGKFYTGNTATLRQFEANTSNTGIIHLATHAYSDNRITQAGIEFYDSTLHLDRIYAMPLKAKLVVLSGCETGTGAVNKTEGLMSLARGFSYAGTKNVIASLWQTEDNSSAEIFKSFYSNLSGNDFSTALYKAKLSAINNSTAASASPFYWSGYIYIGSLAESISPQSTGKLKWIAVLGGLALIVIYFFLKRERK